jgi:hypothetical protein
MVPRELKQVTIESVAVRRRVSTSGSEDRRPEGALWTEAKVA